MATPFPLSETTVLVATELADPNFSLSVPAHAKNTIRMLLDAYATNAEALDRIATRVTDDDYDNPSSALEAITSALEQTGRVAAQSAHYDD